MGKLPGESSSYVFLGFLYTYVLSKHLYLDAIVCKDETMGFPKDGTHRGMMTRHVLSDTVLKHHFNASNVDHGYGRHSRLSV